MILICYVNDIVLVYTEIVPRHFWKISIVTGVLPCRDSKIRGAIVRMTKATTILKRLVNKFFTVKNTCQTLTRQIRQGDKN